MKTLTGYLREVSDGSWSIDTEDGGCEVVTKDIDAPINRLAAFSLTPENHVIDFRPLREPTADPYPVMTVALVRFIDPESTPEHEAGQQDIVDEAAQELEH
ncbi:MAG: hypothetical protein KJO69_07995, partial [Gammaproteobacteria bacterium]|nr:hypothetical protein [Gammaproteobacteria bacterium]